MLLQVSETLNFRAEKIGNVLVTANTIQTMVTVVIGVTNVNNVGGASQKGAQQESDSALRLRRQRSVTSSSTSYVDSIRAAIFSKQNVTDVSVFDNIDEATDSDGTPAHSIWCIVKGGADQDIGSAIYGSKSDGSGMRGLVNVPITSQSGQVFDILFDRPIDETLYMSITIKRTELAAAFDTSSYKEYLVSNLSYSIAQGASSSEIITTLAPEVAGGVLINVGVSKNTTTYTDYIEPSSKQNEFIFDENTIAISVI